MKPKHFTLQTFYKGKQVHHEASDLIENLDPMVRGYVLDEVQIQANCTCVENLLDLRKFLDVLIPAMDTPIVDNPLTPIPDYTKIFRNEDYVGEPLEFLRAIAKRMFCPFGGVRSGVGGVVHYKESDITEKVTIGRINPPDGNYDTVYFVPDIDFIIELKKTHLKGL